MMDVCGGVDVDDVDVGDDGGKVGCVMLLVVVC